jgi:hypothetical protein
LSLRNIAYATVLMPLSRDEMNAALQGLLQTRSPIANLVAPAESGVYAIYLRSRGLLAPFVEGDNGLIYIGLSTNLASREFEQHFSSINTGFSTLRRSLGAILKPPLALRALPRGRGLSEKDCQLYCFVSDGEDRLTDWMREHLEVGVYASPKYADLENFLLAEFVPLLNLKDCPNPHRAEIKRLRKVCAHEARQARQAAV